MANLLAYCQQGYSITIRVRHRSINNCGIQLHLLILYFAIIAAWWALSGCATAPHVYKLTPAEVEALRADIDTVGVVLLTSPAQQIKTMPARGAGEGLVRGAAIGAAMPVIVGFVSPIPGGTAVGVILAPIGFVAGGVYGAATALPEDQVNAARQMLERAVDTMDREGLLETFRKEVLSDGKRDTGLAFVQLSQMDWENEKSATTEKGAATSSDIDAVMEIRLERSGLQGEYSIDPPVSVFVEVSVRLIRTRDDNEIMNETFVCRSDEEKTLVEWAADGGRSFVKEFIGCVPEMAEKIVDDLFLVYPMAVERQQADLPKAGP